MKKLVIGLMTLALTVGLSLSVMAGTPVITGDPLPAGSVEHEAWELIDGVWSSMGTGGLGENARAWSSTTMNGICNKTYWNIPVTVHASVAQWIEFSISGIRYDWRVRKPGTYAGNSLTATLKSNGDLELDFEGFGNLVGATDEIPIWYAYGEGPPGGLNWVTAADLNGSCLIDDSEGLHSGYSFKLWNKIEVVECDSACEYEDEAKITLVLMNAKTWIDPETGEFKM